MEGSTRTSSVQEVPPPTEGDAQAHSEKRHVMTRRRPAVIMTPVTPAKALMTRGKTQAAVKRVAKTRIHLMMEKETDVTGYVVR